MVPQPEGNEQVYELWQLCFGMGGRMDPNELEKITPFTRWEESNAVAFASDDE